MFFYDIIVYPLPLSGLCPAGQCTSKNGEKVKFPLPVESRRNYLGYKITTTPPPVVGLADGTAFLKYAVGSFKSTQFTSRPDVYRVEKDEHTRDELAKWTSLVITTMHDCFDQHHPMTLSPSVMWYMIVHEVAEHIRRNSGRYAHLFTKTPDAKRTIEVRDDTLVYGQPTGWLNSINLVRQPLEEVITSATMQLFVPAFSGMTLEEEVSLLVTLMDAASPFYGYEWRTMCGIPQVTLEGSQADWQLLVSQAERMAGAIDGLEPYFQDLLPVLKLIAETAKTGTVNEDFWTSMYKFDGGSGGPYINGWITAFFAHLNTHDGIVPREEFGWERMAKSCFSGFQVYNFPAHVTRVRLAWNYLGTNIPMSFLSGVLGVDYSDGSLTPRLGVAVIED